MPGFLGRLPRALQAQGPAAALITLGFAAICYVVHNSKVPADFYALTLAAQNFQAGAWDAIYAPAAAVFDLSHPEVWTQQAVEQGIKAEMLFPFIYPPLWAAVFAPLTDWLSPRAMAQVAYAVNPLLLGLCAWLAHRIARPAIGLGLWQAVALAFLGVTSFGYVALFQNQPQIVVTLLILLALERDRAQAPVAAGIAMALAASIKLYPAVFALLWLATRNLRAFGAFLATGTALGLLSVALGGWALHLEFLGWIKTISQTFFTCSLCFNANGSLAHWLFLDQIAVNATLGADAANVFFAPKPESSVWFDRMLLVAVIVLAARVLCRADRAAQFTRIWPVILIAVSFASPLAWSYHYLTAVVFVPLLLTNYPRTGAWHIAALTALYFIFPTAWIDKLPLPVLPVQIVGTLGLFYMAVLFFRPEPALHLKRQPLPL